MQRRGVRAWLAGVILATLLIPAAGSLAGTRTSKLHHLQAQQRRIGRTLKIKSRRAAGLRAHVNALNQAIGALQIQINKLAAKIQIVRSQVRTAQAHIDATQAQIDKVKHLAISQAVMLYESGGTQTLDALLQSKSLTELDNRVELLGVAASKNTAALVKYGRLQAQLKRAHQALFRHESRLRIERSGRQRSLDKRAALRRRVAGDLARLNGKIQAGKEKEHGLAAQEDHIRVLIARAQAKHRVKVTKISTQGFIWPLNGPITSPFGMRWGSLHPGIDIGGFTGEPFVAAKGGRVIYASWMDGYGNATMVDVGGGLVTLYGHQVRLGVSVGQTVKQGQVIGYVGCTGFCTGPHLHFEVRVNGTPVDPMRYLP